MQEPKLKCTSCRNIFRSLDLIYYNYLKIVKEKSEQCRHCGAIQNINFKDIEHEYHYKT